MTGIGIPQTGVVRMPLLDAAACDDWAMRVSLLSGHWRCRHPHAPFYTLGLPAYLDAFGDTPRYHDLAVRRASNALMHRHFGALHEQVAAAVADTIGLPCRLGPDEAALPGFHIYLPHPAFTGTVGWPHRDLQHRQAFPQHPAAPGNVLSFTLAISMPARNGMTMWPTDSPAPVTVEYDLGDLVLHSGLDQHRADIACTGDTERITLQGHGLHRGDHMLLYW